MLPDRFAHFLQPIQLFLAVARNPAAISDTTLKVGKVHAGQV
jgi:hypothetical protein